MDEILSLIERLKENLNKQPRSREASLALTKLDECEMWYRRLIRNE